MKTMDTCILSKRCGRDWEDSDLVPMLSVKSYTMEVIAYQRRNKRKIKEAKQGLEIETH